MIQFMFVKFSCNLKLDFLKKPYCYFLQMIILPCVAVCVSLPIKVVVLIRPQGYKGYHAQGQKEKTCCAWKQNGSWTEAFR